MGEAITFIGDLHDDFRYYQTVVQKHKHTVQVGDFGIPSWTNLFYSNIDATRHRVLGGNHDNYDTAPRIPHYLGDFGQSSLANTDFFFIRGGYSIDRFENEIKDYRLGTKTWFREEELNFAQMIECAREYGHKCPDLVVSHECPAFLRNEIHDNYDILVRYGLPPDFASNTSLLLEELWGAYAPKLWVFGHHHKSVRIKRGPTQFVGLAIGETYDAT